MDADRGQREEQGVDPLGGLAPQCRRGGDQSEEQDVRGPLARQPELGHAEDVEPTQAAQSRPTTTRTAARTRPSSPMRAAWNRLTASVCRTADRCHEGYPSFRSRRFPDAADAA